MSDENCKDYIFNCDILLEDVTVAEKAEISDRLLGELIEIRDNRGILFELSIEHVTGPYRVDNERE